MGILLLNACAAPTTALEAEAPTAAPLTKATPTSPSKSTPEIKTDRADMIEIFKANALAEWGDDSQTVNYEVGKQTKAYDWAVKQTAYPKVMERAKQKWQNNYEMVKYTYESQVESYGRCPSN
tara:strand:- start:76 stop:444 length:369 start_codon:yes stop_codon:yes gene_type:complete